MVNDLMELRKLTQSLIEQEQRIKIGIRRWESILEAIPVPIFITNDVGEIEFINAAMEKEFGLSKDGISRFFCYKVIGGFNERCLCYCSSSEKTDEFFKEDLIIGDSLYTHSRTPIFNEDGDVIGYICTLNNITALIKDYSDLKTTDLLNSTVCQ